MLRMKSSKYFLSQKDLNYLGLNDENVINIFKSPEENLSKLISIENSNLGHLTEINTIFDLLFKIHNFKEFILLNNFNRKEALNIIKTGLVKSYKLNEKIYKKETYPQYYYLILVGSVSYYNHEQIFNVGTFFGDEIIRGCRYKYTAISKSDKTILLLLHKEFFNSSIKSYILNANENIQKMLENSFHVFKTFDNVTYHKYYDKMIKLYPYPEEVVVSHKDIANAIFIIYKGNCSLNNKENGDLIILDRGDIFGSESLTNIDDKGNYLDNKYLYNLINKTHNTIIFKFLINDFNKYIIKHLKLQLSSYFEERDDIIQKHKNMKKDLKNRLKKKYTIFKQKDDINELIHLLLYKRFSPEKAEISFNNALEIIRKKEKFENDKQKLIPKIKFLFKEKLDRNKFIRKIPKSKSFYNIKEMNESSIYKPRKSLISKGYKKNDISTRFKKGI